MNSVLLIYPFFNSGTSRSIFRFPPLGLGYLAAAVRDAGYEVSILDCTFMDRNEAISKALKAGADITGIYSMVTMRKDAVMFARALKGKTKLLVAGGPLPSCEPALFLEDFDIVVRGEGEQTFLELLRSYENGRDWMSVPGIAYRNNGFAGKDGLVFTESRQLHPDLDNISPPARDLFPNNTYVEYYKKKTGRAATAVMTTRGCPFSCEFCSNVIFGNSYRERSPQNVVDEVERAISLGYNHVHFADDVFTLKKERVIRVCEEIRQRKLNFTWECLGRVDSIDLELTRQMKEAGCNRIFFGIESADDTILKIMNKKITIEKAAGAIRMTNEAGLKTGAFFILCYPGDSNDTVLKTLKFATALPLDYLSFTLPYPLIGTALYERIRDRITREWDSRQGDLFTEHSLTFKSDFSQTKMKFALLKGQLQFKMRKHLGKLAQPMVTALETVTDTVFRLIK
ncbi:MAG: B12-binding domain-containing radical SAM protein [Dehalococcoidia bacterium]